MERVYQIAIYIKEYYEGEEDEPTGIRVWGGHDPAGLEDELEFLKQYRSVVYKDWHDAVKARDKIVKAIEEHIRRSIKEEEAPIELLGTILTSDGIDINALLENDKITFSVCIESLEVL